MSGNARTRPVLAVFGGSFDPPHMGHVLLPTYLLVRGLAARVLVAPTWSHPFAKRLTSYPTRMAWARAAMSVHGDRVIVSDIERRLAATRADGRPSYSIELLCALAGEHPDFQVRLVFGSDIIANGDFPRWHQHERIQAEFTPIVVPRLGYAEPETCALPEISSTAVRGWIARLRAGEADERVLRRLEYTVPAAVLAQIKEPAREVIWLIGHGHVATHAERWLHARGYRTRMISARETAANNLAGQVTAHEEDGRPRGIWTLCRDPALPAVARGLAEGLARLGLLEVPVLHGAGALVARGDAALGALAERGVPVGTLHPICSLRRELERSRLDRACFGVGGDEPARALAKELIGGQPSLELDGLDARGRVVYHAACALAANHVAVLFGAARDVLVGQGHAPEQVADGLFELLRSSLDNLRALGIPQGVTGPVSRGDHAAVAAHIDALDDDTAALYRALSERLAALLRDEP